TLSVPGAATAERPGLSRFAGKPVVVGFRPEDVADAALRPDLPAENRLQATADLVEALGSDVLVHFGVDAEAAVVQSSDSLQQIRAPSGASSAIARLTPRSDVKLGGTIEL